MGRLIDGIWTTDENIRRNADGTYQRKEAQFRNWITEDGQAGPSGKGGFRAELGRYHLYVSNACPWAHRTLIFRHLKGLTDHIGVSVVHPLAKEHGWSFDKSFQGTTGDDLNDASYLYQIYQLSDAAATSRVSVPVLWDRETKQIVSNESSEIIRMFNGAFDRLTGNTTDYWPADRRQEIEAINQPIYENLNNGVYRCGFARSQAAYDAAVSTLFQQLDDLESRLADRRYLIGDIITEADWRLFATLVRFDPVYHFHFKCNLKRLRDYPNLWGYCRDLFQMPGIADTVHFDHITTHYFASHESINPLRIIPVGPLIDWTEPHRRG